MWYDYIKIRDYDGIKSSDDFDPGLFEVFQGVSLSVGTVSGGGGGDWDGEDDLSTNLWNAQSLVIERQSESLSALADHLGDSTSQGGFWGIINAIFKPVLEEIIEQAIAEAIEHAWGIPDDLAELIASFFIGLWEGVLEALDEFDYGHKQCEALIDENSALLALTISYPNYRLRADMLNQHEECIARLTGNIEKGESSIWKALDALLKFASLFTTDKEDNDDWVSVFDDLESAIDDVDDWVEDVYEADEANLPVPAPPTLPTLPDKNKGQPSKAIIFYLAKLAVKLFMEWLRRKKEHDPDVAEGLEKAFFFIDPADGQKKSILERGLLKRYPSEVLALLEVLDQDVALRDATIDFGSFRITVKGKTIQYG